MGWSKLEDTFRNHRKPKRLAQGLGISAREARGILTGLWSWATHQAPDGDLRDFTDEEIAEGADWPTQDCKNLLSVLQKCVLVDKTRHGYRLHNYMRRAESYRNAKRQQMHRVRKCRATVTLPSRDSHGNVTQRGEERRGEERNREERNREETTLAPLADSVSPKNGEEVSRVWGHWRTHHPRAAQKLKKGMKGYRLIAARLTEGKSVEDLKQAIDGFHLDSWVGRKNFLQLKYLFGDDDLVTKFIGYAVNPPSLLSDKTQRTVAAAQQWLASKGEK